MVFITVSFFFRPADNVKSLVNNLKIRLIRSRLYAVDQRNFVKFSLSVVFHCSHGNISSNLRNYFIFWRTYLILFIYGIKLFCFFQEKQEICNKAGFLTISFFEN